jgi:hypothetical protein
MATKKNYDNSPAEVLASKSLLNTKPYFISDTNAHSDLNGYAIQAIEDTVISAISSNTQGNSLASETILAGHVWYMDVYSITLTSGAVFIHRR